jgi:hypothetical protein
MTEEDASALARLTAFWHGTGGTIDRSQEGGRIGVARVDIYERRAGMGLVPGLFGFLRDRGEIARFPCDLGRFWGKFHGISRRRGLVWAFGSTAILFLCNLSGGGEWARVG